MKHAGSAAIHRRGNLMRVGRVLNPFLQQKCLCPNIIIAIRAIKLLVTPTSKPIRYHEETEIFSPDNFASQIPLAVDSFLKSVASCARYARQSSRLLSSLMKKIPMNGTKINTATNANEHHWLSLWSTIALATKGPIHEDPFETIPKRLKNRYSRPRGTNSANIAWPYENCGPKWKP